MHLDISLNLEKELNDKQCLGAKAIEGPVLIIAGAGSGKTRMITFRIAHMLNQGIHQSNILALTFTNKAAREMADRVRGLTGKRLSNLTISTFHAFGVRVLRKTIHHLGFKDNFSIYDQMDKIALLKECARHLERNVEDLDFYAMANLFSSIKTGRVQWDRETEVFKEFYKEYQEHLHLFNAVDFDDLIMLPIKVFESHPDVLEEYRKRYRYIMVDEFQDTSLVQYRLMKLVADGSRNICVVGDDDQSIYSWRGANYQNIVNFEKDYPERLEIKLEQNYRSTRDILSAANQVIANNTNRKQKELWTGLDHGKAIELYYPDSDTKEGTFIAEMIRTMAMREGVNYHEVGILVRTNNLTTAIEEALLTENIPYKVSGGMSFFQRKEIKDIVSYLRILVNPDDDVNFLRIINTPRRGIGKTTLQHLRALAESMGSSIYSALSALRWATDSPTNDRAKENLADFISFFDHYREKLFSGKKMAESVSAMVDAIDYWGYLLQEHQKNDKVARWKYSNINRFIELFSNWERDPDNHNPTLQSYLNRISLITREEDDDGEKGKVNLMTIHAAKGLEFGTVFLAGVEEGIIPHARSIEENPENIEEERRLFYVAITRAKQKLFLTSCRTRRHIREIIESSASPFLEEIPENLIEIHQPETEVGDEEAARYFAKMKEKWYKSSS